MLVVVSVLPLYDDGRYKAVFAMVDTRINSNISSSRPTAVFSRFFCRLNEEVGTCLAKGVVAFYWYHLVQKKSAERKPGDE